MGCDIHSYLEIKTDTGWEVYANVFAAADKYDDGTEVFPIRSYGLFGFLADVRNYSMSPVIANPRGLPDDVSDAVRAEYGDWAMDRHSASWLTLAELLAYDYDQMMWNRRVTKQVSPGYWNGAALADEGEGEHLTLRDFLGEWYFDRLDELAGLGAPDTVRVVFWFDS